MANGDVYYFRVVFEGGESVIWSWSGDELRAHHPPRALAEEREAEHAKEENRGVRRVATVERLRPPR